MNEYLVLCKPSDTNQYQASIHTWPEILAILKEVKKIGGNVRVFGLATGYPQRLLILNVCGTYMLEDVYGNCIER